MYSNIKIESLDKVLSSTGGLVIFDKICERLDLQGRLSDSLPTLSSGTRRSFRKFLDLMHGFKAGGECLEDMDRYAEDQGFAAVCGGKAYSSKTYGDFLRSFSGIDCLDTIKAFDEHGIQYWHDVRPGATYSSNGITEIIHAVFNQMPKTPTYKKLRRYGRGDSAFCNADFFNACAAKNVGFVVCMKENMFEPLIGNVTDWQKTNPSKEKRIKFYDGRECEIGSTLYRGERGHEILRVVFIRAVKDGHENILFKQQQDYDYYAWVSNIGEHEMDHEKLIKFYRKRGQMENYIKELKHGYDLKHYPCLKLTANKAYGLIAAFSHNIMRFVSLKDNPDKPQYAKALRHRFVHLPCQVVRHGRQVIFRFMNHHHKEVEPLDGDFKNNAVWFFIKTVRDSARTIFDN